MVRPTVSYRRSVHSRAGTPAAAAPAATPPALLEPRPDMLMRALALMLIAYVWRIQDTFPFLGKLKLPIVAAALATALYVAARHPWRRAKLLRGPLLSILLAMLALMVIGVPVALVRGTSAMFILKTVVPNLLFMTLVAASIRSTRDLEWFAKLNLYGGLIYATVINLFFRVGYDGRYNDLVYYDANDFALVVVATIPFAVYALRKGNSRDFRIAGLIAIVMFMTCVMRSGSRGGFLGFVAVMAFILFRYRAIPSRIRLFAGVGGLIIFCAVANEAYWEKVRSIVHPTSDYNYTSSEGRKAVWTRGVGYMITHPVLGVGVANFPNAEGYLSGIGQELAAQGKGWKWSVAHNSFVEVGAELGVVGLGLFVAIFVVAIRRLSLIRPRSPTGLFVTTREQALAQMLIGSFIGYAIAGFFVSAEHFSYFYFLLGLVIGLVKLVRLRHAALFAMPAPPPMGARPPRPSPAMGPSA